MLIFLQDIITTRAPQDIDASAASMADASGNVVAFDTNGVVLPMAASGQ